MVCFAAHTARDDQQLLRAKVADVDFEAETVLIHEMKRQRGAKPRVEPRCRPSSSTSYRRGSKSILAARNCSVSRPRSVGVAERSPTTGHKGMATRASTQKDRQAGVRTRVPAPSSPLSKDEAHDHLRRTLRGSKWEVIRGWHIFRHSFISCCASAGVDQRFIDEWVGHTTEEMRERYRHLVPSTQKTAIRTVFG